MIQHLTWTVAFLFITIGALGFVPGVTTDDGYLFGIFMTSPAQNIFYIVAGLAAAAAVAISGRYAVRFFQVLGVLATVTAGSGIVTGDVFNLFPADTIVNAFHTLVAMGALLVGFGMKHDEAASLYQRI